MKKRLLAALLAMVLICPTMMTAFADEGVKVSNVDYDVFLNASEDVFICNEKSIGSAVGTEYFMTYTVKSVTSAGATQQGVIGTEDKSASYPFFNVGYMYYEFSQDMLQQGYTYFIEFTIVEGGYEYSVAKAKAGEEPEYVYLQTETGSESNKLTHFGLWFGVGKVTADLTKVRFYDRNGNDLGVTSPRGRAVAVPSKAIAKDTKIDHRYDITVNNRANVAISNELTTDSKKVYMEYKVESSEGNLYQNGLILTNNPTGKWPWSSGGLLHQNEMTGDKEVGPLLTPGAEYLIVFERGVDSFTGVVQKTYKGKTEKFAFPLKAGTYDPTGQYFSIWFGEGDTHLVSCVLRGFKCYDDKGNNLKVQCNQEVTIRHIGALEDYTECEAIYYCEADNSVYRLYKDQTLQYTASAGETETKEGKYSISANVITLKVAGSKTEKVDYRYHTFTDTSERTYKRLYNYKLNFVTGTEQNIDPQILNYTNGYVAMAPETPVLEGASFKGWCDAEGQEYDFNKYVTKSKTLYAKWEGDDGREFIAIDTPIEEVHYTPYIAIVSSVLIILAACVISVVLITRGKKHATK